MSDKELLNEAELDSISGGLESNYSNTNNKKGFYCQYCLHKPFSSKSNLINHIKKNHPGEPIVF